MVTPETESFYVTDMDEYDNSLEIAVLDDGPSADYASYFYRYDGSALAFIGEVDCSIDSVLPGKTIDSAILLLKRETIHFPDKRQRRRDPL